VRKQGFTLLEFLLVTVVIALMTIAIVAFLKNYTSSVMQKRTANDIDTILDHAVIYHLYNNVWPTTFNNFVDDGLLAELQQCSPWPKTTSTASVCDDLGGRQNYHIETSNQNDKHFTISLTLNDPALLDALSGRIANSEIAGSTLRVSVVSPEQIQKETGLFQRFGYTRDDDKKKKDGNGTTIPFDPCPSGVPVIFHAPYAFEGPQMRVFQISTGVWRAMQTLAYPSAGKTSTADPPDGAKLCMKTTVGGPLITYMRPGVRARHRYFTTCLPKDVVDGAYAPPYGSLTHQGNNAMLYSSDYEWCEEL
jgi:competence protein ComGC